MRNTEFLDKNRSEDENIGVLQFDSSGRPFRMINDKPIYQIEEKTQEDVDLNLIINRVRASGLKINDYLNILYN
jgi:hypothetical protein